MDFRPIRLHFDIFDRCIRGFTLSDYTADRCITDRNDQIVRQMQRDRFNIDRIGSVGLVTAGPAADLPDHSADPRACIIRYRTERCRCRITAAILLINICGKILNNCRLIMSLQRSDHTTETAFITPDTTACEMRGHIALQHALSNQTDHTAGIKSAADRIACRQFYGYRAIYDRVGCDHACKGSRSAIRMIASAVCCCNGSDIVDRNRRSILLFSENRILNDAVASAHAFIPGYIHRHFHRNLAKMRPDPGSFITVLYFCHAHKTTNERRTRLDQDQFGATVSGQPETAYVSGVFHIADHASDTILI